MEQRREEEEREWKKLQGSGIYGITVLLSHFTLLRYNLRCALWLVFYLTRYCFSCCYLHTGSAVVYLCRPGLNTVSYIMSLYERFQPVPRGHRRLREKDPRCIEIVSRVSSRVSGISPECSIMTYRFAIHVAMMLHTFESSLYTLVEPG